MLPNKAIPGIKLYDRYIKFVLIGRQVYNNIQQPWQLLPKS
jgi:hypothetical protein